MALRSDTEDSRSKKAWAMLDSNSDGLACDGELWAILLVAIARYLAVFVRLVLVGLLG